MDYTNLMKKPLTLDSTFHFCCDQCGDCCRHREDIILTPYDLFRLATYLKTTPLDVIQQYCIFYIGERSGLPIVLLNAVGEDKHCPFLENNRCAVHASKPTVCALFPLGRFAAVGQTPAETQYFLQPVQCGTTAKRHTVREWLQSFNLQESDQWFQEWQKALNPLMLLIQKAKKLMRPEELEKLYPILFMELYVFYKLDEEFLPQFIRNTTRFNQVLEQFLGQA